MTECFSHGPVLDSRLLALFRCSLQLFFFFFKQKTAYEMRISDWSSDVCSSDLPDPGHHLRGGDRGHRGEAGNAVLDQPTALQQGGEGRCPVLQIGRASCRERVCQYV